MSHDQRIIQILYKLTTVLNNDLYRHFLETTGDNGHHMGLHYELVAGEALPYCYL